MHYLFAQSASVKGVTRDTSDNKNLSNATISLLRSSDSILVKYTRTDKEGRFSLSGLPAGDYVLLITYPRFADFAEKLTLTASQDMDMATVPLTLKSQLMQEVVVRSAAAIKVRGDTTEFTADSFHVRPGATVDELLKQLPGLQVNSKGQITAQGKKVDKVLVDGEEFFGEDPTIATQNIGAKAVDKVQVYDTKTDQDQLKGIGASGDGNKTINIKLKADAKKGYFGKLEGSTDFDKLANAKAMYNLFRGNKKFSVYGTKSNISTGSLGWEERNKLGIENDYEFDELNGYYYSYGSGDDEFNNWNLRGIPNSYTAGALYGDKWNEEKNKLNLSYLYNRLGTTNTNRKVSQTLLEDTTFFNNSLSRTSGLSQQHSVNGKYEWKIDSMASIKYTVAGIYRQKDNFSDTYSEALNEDRDTVNNNKRTNEQTAIKRQMDNALTYRQQFKKKNRLLMATLRLGLVDDQVRGHLLSRSQFYKNNMVDSTDNIDQQKRNDGNSTTFGSRITFNEPLNDLWNLVAEYSFNANNSSSYQNSYDRDFEGKYTVRNNQFSNNSDLNATSHSGTVTARFNGKKIKYAFGAGLSSIRLNLHNLNLDSKTNYHFTGFTPQAQFRYNIKAQTGFSMSYRGNTVQPTLTQLQPLQNNNDPLTIYVGNPDLKVGFNHNININFNDFKVLSGRYTWVGAGINFQRNAITNRSTVDEFGKTTYVPVNVNGNYNYYLYGNWNSGQGDKKLIHSINPEANGGRSVNYVNGKENVNTYYGLQLGYGLSYSVQEKYNIELRPKIERNISKSSLRPNANNNYWTYGGGANVWVQLPWKFEISSDIDANLRQSTNAFAGNNMTVWNAEFSRKFMKEKALKISVIAHDILNQNIGFERTINSNYISEQRYDMLGRYFLLSASWTFNKMPGKK